MDKDKISELPEALILQILSSLPTKIVVTTSVLSKRWTSLWKFVPSLKFNYMDFNKNGHNSFSENVCKCFLSHKAPILNRLYLKFPLEKATPIDIGVWVGIAFARNLRELELYFLLEDDGCFAFPSSLCTSNTLETLKLSLMTLDISSPVLMKSLRTLHLSYVHYKEASIRNFLSGCPVLEELFLLRGEDEDTDIKAFVIEVPSLQRLTINDDQGYGFWGYMVKTPSLNSIRIETLSCQGFYLNAPELMEAHIADSTLHENFLGYFTSVRRLSFDLSSLKITYRTGTIFYQLVYLEMVTREDEWWNLLTSMLENSPKLQFLKLVDRYLNFCKDYVKGGKWNEPKSVPKCLLSHLETFVWTRYDWGRKEEREVATYILKNARQLKTATFSTCHVQSDSEELSKLEELNKLEKRSKRLNELDGVVRASKACHLVFIYEEPSSYSSDDSP